MKKNQNETKPVDLSTKTKELKRTDGKPVLRARRCKSEDVKTKTEKVIMLKEAVLINTLLTMQKFRFFHTLFLLCLFYIC